MTRAPLEGRICEQQVELLFESQLRQANRANFSLTPQILFNSKQKQKR